jgi:formiminoglutamase
MFAYRVAPPWHGRTDSQDGAQGLRLHQQVKYLDLGQGISKGSGYCLMGYAADEGVARNQGRVGSAFGPDSIRKFLASLPKIDHAFFDAGEVYFDPKAQLKEPDPLSTQDLIAEKTAQLLKANYFPIWIGGGHEMAFGHYKGYTQYGIFPSILNIDAHFDLRKPAPLANSGTPFYQIAELNRNLGKPFNYFCAGIKRQANTQALFDRADEWNVSYTSGLNRDAVSRFFSDKQPIWLSVDMDSMNLPGVSASNPLGFNLQEVIDFVVWLRRNFQIVGLEIAELNPHYDFDGITAKSAAWLLWDFVAHIQN